MGPFCSGGWLELNGSENRIMHRQWTNALIFPIKIEFYYPFHSFNVVRLLMERNWYG